MNQDEFMYEKKLTSVVPSARQLALEQMEFYGFIHFTVNTFTDREWGDGTESESVFNPTNLDADEWAQVAKEAEIGKSSNESNSIDCIRVDDDASFVVPKGTHTLTVTAKWNESQTIQYVVLKEDITKSQRVEQFILEAADEAGNYQTIYEGTVISYKKIACLEKIQTDALRLSITKSRVSPTLRFMGIY